MRLVRLGIAALLFTVAASLTGTVLTRSGVGAAEYLAAALLVVLLVRAGLAVGRSGPRGWGRTPESASE